MKDPYLMAEILRKQYESTFSIPDPVFNIDNIGEFFYSCGEQEQEQEQEKEQGTEQEDGEDNEKCADCTEQSSHECSVEQSETSVPPTVGPSMPTLTDVHFNYTDIADAIDQLSLCSGPGPDGISAIL